ncbi:MAG: hypothetical protein ACOY3P_12330 [Planctomycetota bacterium]
MKLQTVFWSAWGAQVQQARHASQFCCRLLPAVLAVVAVCGCFLSAARAAELKEACSGLMTRDSLPPQGWSFIDSAVVQVSWKDLEPEDQQFRGPGWETIERARRSGVKLKLRVFSGVHAPAFVKRLGGPGISAPEHNIDCSKTGGVAIFNRHDKRGGVIPRFWLPEYLDQYEQLMTEVARRYDNAPEIHEVVASGAMTLYAEPFYRAHSDAGTNQRLFQAGLTFEKDQAAHRRIIELHHRLFQRTRTSLAINAWDIIDASPKHYRSSFEPTYEFVQWARGLMGEKLVLQNNGTGADAGCPAKANPRNNHFCYLAQVAGPKGFQTRTLARLGGNEEGLKKTLDAALRMGANFVELPSGFAKFEKPWLAEYDRKLEANSGTPRH